MDSNTSQAGTEKSILFSNVRKPDSDSVYLRKVYRLRKIRRLTEDTFVLRFDRNDMQFKAGQHITLGIPGNNQVREYSIYSTEHDSALEVLIKEVDTGTVSRQLKKLIPGELLDVDGPFGYFTVDEKNRGRKFLFVGTGTGISPFRSISGSYPDLNYKILHGVRFLQDAHERHHYPDDRYVLCTSRDKSGDFHGRVIDYMKQMVLDSDTLVYLCGNCDMIYDVYDYLTSKGFPSSNIKTEVYF